MPTRTPAKRNTDGGGFFRAAAALLGAALLGALVLWLSRARPLAPLPAPPAQPSAAAVSSADVPVASPRAAEVPSGDAALAQDLAALVKADPARALARILAERPATEAEAQRLKVLEVRALVGLGRIGSARSQAADYYRRWPNGPDVVVLGQLTGRHPTPDR